ncbi:MAG: glucan 1,4-alpha-glucosidase [Desulfuromonadales bacterium]
MDSQQQYAPGWPGIPARWTSSAKSGVGTSLNPNSRVWFTISHGIINEVYYPRIDKAAIRDLGLIITDGIDFFSEEKRDALSVESFLAPGVPAYRVENRCLQGRYRIEKEILSDPRREVLLQKVSFVPLQGVLGDYHLYALLAPHLDNHGAGNTGWVGDYKGLPMLFAERNGSALAMACSVPWRERSVGFVGTSDGWQDLAVNRSLTACYQRAENGNLGLTGEVDLIPGGGEFVLVTGFGTNPAEAGHRARASLLECFPAARQSYLEEWQAWQETLQVPGDKDLGGSNLIRVSTAVLRCHEEKRFPGGQIASLSIPWGYSKGDEDLGGYHLVWPRDLVESAGGLLAAGAGEDVRRILRYLQTTQEADGHWLQNMWMDGSSYWHGVQMDETALPILLVDLARREGALDEGELAAFLPMVQAAAGFLVRNGPVTPQDRWEEDPGYAPFTLAAEIAALLAAAELIEQHGMPDHAHYLRETADTWNDAIERWIYVTGTDLAREHGVDGYYVRIAPPEICEAASPLTGYVAIKNRPPGQSNEPAAHIISPDALALVRFGLRAADDCRICNTVNVIDALLKVETDSGPAWHRYNDDGYGEHEDGAPFDGTGIGRAWPLLTGERAHYELAAGRPALARDLRAALERFAGESGLLPEQVWDSQDIPERELFNGRPSGSAMPLVWAHAEYIKLCHSLADGRVFDMPPHTVQRYLVDKTTSNLHPWRFNHKCRGLPRGRVLRIELLAPARVHWSTDNWATVHDSDTKASGFGIHYLDIPSQDMKSRNALVFTFFWSVTRQWQGTDFEVIVE